MPTKTTSEGRVAVEDFLIHSPISLNGEHDCAEIADILDEVASNLASDIGMRLADLGASCSHGKVTIHLDGNLGASGADGE